MADIELIIKIPEEDYKFLREAEGCRFSKTIIDGVINGIPLPKGHGRLIYADELKTDVGYTGYNYDFQNCIDDAPTIIEADECTYEETGCGSCKRQLDCPIEADRSESEG